MTALRNFKIGNIYHLIKRGVGDQKVFLDKQDYSRFSLDVEFCNNQKDINLWDILVKGRKENKETKVGSKQTLTERIEKARSKKGEPLVKLLGFALMPTHIHFIVREIIDHGISEFMRKLGGYTSYYNNRHDRGGTLFRRYESVPVETDQQLHIVFAYVHTNPISLWEPGWKEYEVQDKKKALEKLENYPWSTYPTYIGKNRFLHSIERNFFLNFFGSEQKCKQVIKDWIDYKAAETSFDRAKFE